MIATGCVALCARAFPFRDGLYAAITCIVMFNGGCATYIEEIAPLHRNVDQHRYGNALALANHMLGVDSSDNLPATWNEPRPLLVLERAVLLQATERYADSARDFQAADAQLEWLDLTHDPLGTIGRFLYSDAAPVYHTTPVEKLHLNAFNMLNYLARGDLRGAAVEARRYTVMQQHLAALDEAPDSPMAAYLSGFVFEQLDDPNRAMRYYEDALGNASPALLEQPIRRLAKRGAYRSEKITAFLDDLPDGSTDDAEDGDTADLLIIIAVDRVPHRAAERVPIGLAIGIAGTVLTDDPRFLERTALKWIVYPELVPSSLRRTQVEVRLNDRPLGGELLADVGQAIRSEYDQLRPMIIASALTRLAIRAGAAEGARGLGRKDSPELGTIAALLTEGLLLAADKPDTRSWTLLPGRVYAARSAIPAGEHELLVYLNGDEPHRRHIVAEPGSFGVVVVTAP